MYVNISVRVFIPPVGYYYFIGLLKQNKKNLFGSLLMVT